LGDARTDQPMPTRERSVVARVWIACGYAGSAQASSAWGGSRASAKVAGSAGSPSVTSRLRARAASATTATTLRRPLRAESSTIARSRWIKLSLLAALAGDGPAAELRGAVSRGRGLPDGNRLEHGDAPGRGLSRLLIRCGPAPARDRPSPRPEVRSLGWASLDRGPLRIVDLEAMSGPRRWLALCIVAAACSTPNNGEVPKGQTTKAVPAAAPQAPQDGRYDTGALGATKFAVSDGTPEARTHFMRGLLALHSFWYDEATRQFQAAIAADPTMNMAYWGVAMSSCKLLWGDDDVDAAQQSLARMPAPERLSPRERAWVTATNELLAEGNVRSSRKRFAAAMESLHAQFPDDESATFLAIALIASTRPEDPDALAVRKRAATLAAGVFEHNPNHPGAAHYAIHAYDTPELAPLAMPYARKYAQIAPEAFHARHMPAHIFSRLGMWKEAIASCQSAWDVSVAAAKRENLSADHDDFHSLNWVIEMSFELGRRKDAEAAMAVFSDAVRGGLSHKVRGLYAIQVASFLVRTGAWSRVDELLAPLDTPAVDDPPSAMAATPAAARNEPMGHCGPALASSPMQLQERLAILNARARGASAKRDLASTKRFLADMDAVSEQMRPFLQATQPPQAVAKINESNARRRASLLARATGDDRALLKVLSESVADSDREVGGENNPSAFLIHEEIAETLMRLGQVKDAAAEYARALDKHPKRARSILGSARAAAKLGDATAARAWYQQLVELWSGADEGTDGLAEARTAVAASR
jgi:tetratricopeptide (TPR) repeat protein